MVTVTMLVKNSWKTGEENLPNTTVDEYQLRQMFNALSKTTKPLVTLCPCFKAYFKDGLYCSGLPTSLLQR